MTRTNKLNIALLVLVLILGTLQIKMASTAPQVITKPAVLPQVNLPDQQPSPLEQGSVEIKDLEIDLSRTLFLEGEVNENALVLAAQIKMLSDRDSDSPIYLVITSPGGSVITGATLLSAIELSRAPVYTVCRAICASMAAITFQYGSKRFVTDKTLLMYHPASMGTEGNINNVSSEVNAIKRFVNKIEVTVAKKMGLTYEEYQNQAAQNIWVDSREGLERRFVDEIVDIRVKRNGLPVITGNKEQIFTSPIKDDKFKNILKRIKWEL